MALLEPGRICIKKNGRDAGSKAVVTKAIDTTHVMVVTTARPKERRCNVTHLEYLGEKIDPADPAQVKHALGIVEKAPHREPKQAKKA